MLRAYWFVVMNLALTVLVAGCSKSEGNLPDLGPVSGTVTMDGKPLGKAAVVFESADGHAAYGVTDESGRYELVFAGQNKGAVVGPNTVRITTALDGPTPADYKEPIPAKYNESSQLNVTVQAGPNTHDFALEP